MNEAVFLTFPDVDEGSVNAWEHIFDGSEVDVTDLITTLGNDQLIDAVIGEHCCDSQLLRDDDVLGHGMSEQEPTRALIRSETFRSSASGVG